MKVLLHLSLVGSGVGLAVVMVIIVTSAVAIGGTTTADRGPGPTIKRSMRR